MKIKFDIKHRTMMNKDNFRLGDYFIAHGASDFDGKQIKEIDEDCYLKDDKIFWNSSNNSWYIKHVEWISREHGLFLLQQDHKLWEDED